MTCPPCTGRCRQGRDCPARHEDTWPTLADVCVWLFWPVYVLSTLALIVWVLG